MMYYRHNICNEKKKKRKNQGKTVTYRIKKTTFENH